MIDMLKKEVDLITERIFMLKSQNLLVDGFIGPGDCKYPDLRAWIKESTINTRHTFGEIRQEIEKT